MLRLVLGGVLAAALLSGCGGGSGSDAKDDASSSPRASGSASPSPSASASTATYFVSTDSAAINAASAKAQKAGDRTLAKDANKRCNNVFSTGGLPAWRSCWHGLLDPFRINLLALSSQLATLSSRDFPAQCQSGLRDASDHFAELAGRIDPLLAGIDSDKRAQQSRAMRQYTKTLVKIGQDYSKPFRPLTLVCYSPKDLESINASPSASASPSS